MGTGCENCIGQKLVMTLVLLCVHLCGGHKIETHVFNDGLLVLLLFNNLLWLGPQSRNWANIMLKVDGLWVGLSLGGLSD